ncbi:MAG: PH domain-containing protein [Chloroflexota bacterium]|nr:PH domain-containing protein [Chloroflexota bacterium]
MSEETLVRTRESWLSLAFWLKLILTLGLYFFRWLGKRLIVTDRRVIWREGLLGGIERSVPLEQVQDITIHRGLFGRILGYGNVHIETAGGSATEVVAKNMRRPEAVRDAILKGLAR